MLFNLEIMLILILTLISFKFNILKKNFYLVFNIFWLACLVFSKLNYFKLYEVSMYTYQLICIGIISFNFSMFLPLRQIKNFKIEKIKKIKPKWTNIFIYSYLIINLGLIFVVIKHIDVSEKYYLVRFFYYGIDGKYLFKYSILQMLYEVIQAFNEFFMLYGIYLILENPKNKFCFYCSFLNFILFTFISGSRDLLFYLIIILLICLKTRRIKIFIKEIIIFIVIVTIVSLNRGTNSFKDMAELVVFYFTGSINFMDIQLKKEIVSEYFYGRLFFSSFLMPIEFLLKKMGILSQISIYYVSGELAKTVNISEVKAYNALATAFYIFYRDMGSFGVIFYSILVGIFYKLIYYSNKLNNVTVLLFSYLEVILIYTTLTFKFNKFIFFIPILMFYILKKRIGLKKSM